MTNTRCKNNNIYTHVAIYLYTKTQVLTCTYIPHSCAHALFIQRNKPETNSHIFTRTNIPHTCVHALFIQRKAAAHSQIQIMPVIYLHIKSNYRLSTIDTNCNHPHHKHNIVTVQFDYKSDSCNILIIETSAYLIRSYY